MNFGRRRTLPWPALCGFALVAMIPATLGAQTATSQSGGQDPQAPLPATPSTTFNVTVVGTTPLEGVELPVGQIPAPVQTLTASDIDKSGALDLASYMNLRLNGVHVNEVQGNPFQPDVNYRGYTASPLLGTPQGLSVYMDGVRLNQPFGEVVSWDLIPRMAISSGALMPGSNPLFGLNTLGGALSIQTKDGRNAPGTRIQAIYGSDVRRSLEFEHGGSRSGSGVDWYVAGNIFAEDGWRDASPSEVGQLFGKLGWRRNRGDVSVTLAYADTALTGNALQEIGFLDRDFSSVYTKPDETDNRSVFLNVEGRRALTNTVVVSGNAYFRHIGTDTLNGDINEESLDQSLYQPTAAEQAALLTAGYITAPVIGANATNTPFPYLRCVGNVLLNDEPAEKCNGLINRSESDQNNGGFSGQLTVRDSGSGGRNVFTVGGGFDGSGVGFVQSTELGYLNPDRSIAGTGAFADGVSGGGVDGEPFDTRVNLDGSVRTWSVFATDTLALAERWHLTVSGRFNRTTVANTDLITAEGEPGSLTGHHVFTRLNPAVGVTFDPTPRVNLYAGYNEGSRAATSIELGCADPERPCKLPNAMAGDPPLDQVVTRTVEAGVRSQVGPATWHAGYFRAQNNDDILFVTSEQTGFGYFRNFGETRRQGIELGLNGQIGRVAYGAGYTFLDATFESEETVNGGSNGSNDAAEEGRPGLEGTIEIAPGDRLPFIPRHQIKLFADIQITSAFALNVDIVGFASSLARGNENNLHQPDGTYYLGEGTSPGYGVVNLGGRYTVTRWLQIFGQINNLFDQRYYSAAQLGPLGFTENETFIARPLPPIGGEFPVMHSTFYAPGAPIRGWIGTRLTF
jgi:outer membrane receptor protein involved in Fe transport